MDNYSIQSFIQLMHEESVDVQQLYQLSGLSLKQLEQHEALLKLVPVAMRMADHRGWGLKLGARMNIPQLGVIGYALMSCADGEAALKLLLHYQRIIMPELVLALNEQNGHAILSCHADHLPLDLQRFCIETFFVAVSVCAAELLGLSPANARYRFAYPAPDYQQDYGLYLKGEFSFDAEESQIVFPMAALKTPLSSANPVIETIYCQQCDVLLQQLDEQEPVSARVQQLFLNRRGSFPDINQVAKQLNMSESTLRRRLREEGSGFQKLLDKVRLHLAHEYLKATALPVAEVGRLLGFDDVANFRHAFSRWSGMAPSQFRAQHH